MQSQVQRRRSPRVESAMEHLHKSRKNGSQLQSLEFDSEPTYYRLQVHISILSIIMTLIHYEREKELDISSFKRISLT